MEVRPESAAAPPKMTYEEFLDWADEDTHAEWVEGEVVFMSPVSNVHQDIGLFLISCLTFYVQERQLGRIFYAEFQMKLGPGLPGRQPDVLFVSAANLSRLRRNYLDGPADLAVEIISPESVERDRVQKFAEYQQGGVGEYWLIDPLERTAQFYQRSADGRFVLVPLDKNGVYHSMVLDGFWLKADWLWQSPLPTLRTVLEEWGVM
jgi:Uma2 family endonuclease